MRRRALNGILDEAPFVGGLEAGGDGYRDRMVVTLLRCHL